MHDHCADNAELYALGALDDAERDEVEQHLRECPACARLVGAAESEVATIAAMEPVHAAPRDLSRRMEELFRNQRQFARARIAPPAWRLPATIAAALIVGLLPSLFLWAETRNMRGAMLAQTAAMERVMAQPHRLSSFQTMAPPTTARVAYAPNGSWYVVVVAGASKPLGVAWMHGGKRTMLGEAVPHGNLAMLYLPKSHRMDRLALMDGDRIVGQAILSWGKTLPDRQGARSS